ncbi:ADP-heptose synthase [Pseudoalteromonas luteoviolacea B = ATCC 29581]|nr:ADP-heptose synthase [Pseudoalteromonas luteoviolacea B = ATCC 29581]
MKRVLVYGKFDILHPGHVRLLNFAKECGDFLTVAIYSDEMTNGKCQINEKHRLELIQSLEAVDEAFITNQSPNSIILETKPHIVVKGKEFENRINEEKELLESFGGKLVFGSGNIEFSAYSYRNKNKFDLGQTFDFTEVKKYALRHNITQNSVSDIFANFHEKKVCVVGEVIVDEYVQGSAIGMSQEDPTIVMTPTATDVFLGGAAITAGHIKALGANCVNFVTVIGVDQSALFVSNNIKNYKLKEHLFTDISRPTPTKTRFRANGKTLLRVNKCRQNKISQEIQSQILNRLKDIIPQTDVLVFSDFNYGVLPQALVESISNLCKEFNVLLVADSQTSSQVGDISRYKGMNLITPTEKEVRVALGNYDDGLPILANKLYEKSKPENLVITLGEDGIFIHIPNQNGTWENDILPAINRKAIDPAGAGDCFLAASSLAIASGADAWTAFYVGSIAAACQVDNLGNTPLELSVLEKAIEDSFK